MLRGNRFRLVTLGRLTLVGGAGEEDPSLAKRRRKLALLAVLAMARRPIARDTLVEMFWGEQDEDRARHSLSNTLSSLRRALGQSAITTRDADVALAADLPLDVDALELAEAVEGHDFARAAELYGGPFLEAIHIEESPSFEQWVSRERRRLEALFVQACAQQCAMLARARNWPECHALAERWLDVESLSSDAAIYLLNAIKAPGTRAALAQGLDEYERLRMRLSREFELAPDAAVRELAERMREQLATMEPEPAPPAIVAATAQASAPVASAAAAPTPLAATEAPPDAARVPDERAAQAPLAAPAESTAPVRHAVTPLSARRHRGVVWSIVGAATVVGLAMAMIMLGNGGGSVAGGGAAARRPVIAVLRINTQAGDSSLAWLSDGLPRMITGKLAHNEQVDVVDPTQVSAVLVRSGRDGPRPLDDATARDLARRVGATVEARGALARDGATLVLDLSVHDVASGALMRTDVLTSSDPLALADGAAVRVLAAASVTAPGPQMSGLESTSLEAYQHFMRALEAQQAGRITEGVRELDAAIALDSGFIPVVRARIGAALAAEDTALVRRLAETIRTHASRASDFDRMYQEVQEALYGGEHERSEALARALVRRFPRDPGAYQTLEGVLTSHGRNDEAEQVAIQVLALDSLAMEAGSGPCMQCTGFYNILALDWARSDFASAAAWARRWIRVQPDGANAWSSLAWTYAYMQRPDSALPLLLRAVSLSGGDEWADVQYARMLLMARRYDAADSAIAVLEVSPHRTTREDGADLRSLLEREHGRMRASNRALDRLLAASPGLEGFGALMRADNLRRLGDYTGAARMYERLSHTPGERLTLPIATTGVRAFCWHHALAADAYAGTNDTVSLRATADTLERGCSRSFYARDWRLYHHVRGLIAMRGARYAEAEREFAQAVWLPVEGWTRTTVELAAAQSALGRPLDAIKTLRTGYASRLDAMSRYVPVSELDFRMARAFAQAGMADSARVYAGYVRRAWRDADPEVTKLLAQLP